MRHELTVFQAARGALKARAPRGLSMVDDSRGWNTLLSWAGGTGELASGSWQRDEAFPPDRALAHFAVYACITQIASDIAKLCLDLKQRNDNGTWQKVEVAAYSPFLRKPNHYQTRQQFVETWQLSKQTWGNTLALKERDNRNVVVRQYVLDWHRCTPLVAQSGDVYYELRTDDLSRIPQASVTVPASEVIHDRFNCIFHPLIGVSPLFAAGLAARQGIEIQANSARFFENMSRPSGVLTAPNRISDETAKRLKDEWEGNYGKGKIGKVAVLGDSLKYEPMAVTPENAELVKQLEITAKMVCAAYKVPLWKIGFGPAPAGDQKIQDLNNIYYSDCLQAQIEAIEALQDEALALDPAKYRVEFDLDDLLRMDSKGLAETEGILVQRGIRAPNESRRKFNDPPVPGGESPYLQQQNFSLAALAKRDASADPFGTAPAPAPAPADPPQDEEARAMLAEIKRRQDEAAARERQREAAYAEAIASFQRGIDQLIAEQRAEREASTAQAEALREAARADAERQSSEAEKLRKAAQEALAEAEASRLVARVRERVNAAPGP